MFIMAMFFSISQVFAGVNTINPGGQPYFRAYLSANQTVTHDVTTKVTFDTKVFDSGTYYDNTTNYRYTPLVAGKYKVTVVVFMQANTVLGTQQAAHIYKNGSSAAEVVTTDFGITTGGTNSVIVSDIITFNGTTDYIEGWAYVGGASTSVQLGSNLSYIEAYYIGP